jgi:ATP synthase protein I
LIAGPAGGALVGWVLDRWLGIAPALLLTCMFLGIAVAFRNIIKISAERPD